MDHPRIPDRYRAIADALRADNDVMNADFDALLPRDVRVGSLCYWTPLRVALVAARWLEAHGATRVLDVGAGVGKFCTVGAIVTDLVFHGIERRARLVNVATRLAELFGVSERTGFIAGELDAVDLRDYDALYFYNPFAEGYHTRASWLDESVELGPGLAKADTDEAEKALASLELGARVVTYHGYGGRIPDSFALVHSWAYGNGRLLCWQKTRARSSGEFFEEDDWA